MTPISREGLKELGFVEGDPKEYGNRSYTKDRIEILFPSKTAPTDTRDRGFLYCREDFDGDKAGCFSMLMMEDFILAHVFTMENIKAFLEYLEALNNKKVYFQNLRNSLEEARKAKGLHI